MKIRIGLLLLAVQISFAAPELVESIVAVVDGKVILKSELMAAVLQSQSTPGFAKLDAKAQQERVLQSMIDEKVILARADKDSISITDAEVRGRVDSHIQTLMSRQKLDMKALEKAIRAQVGLSMAQYRDQLTKQIHDQMLMARIRQRHIGVIQPTRQEVEKFFREYKDSLPLQYNSILVSHIQIKIQPSRFIVDSVRAELAKLVDSLDQGIAWEVLAQRYSQDSMAAKGGDLGFFRKGILEPEYERAAWKLDLGRYTDEPVKTRLGWHLIRILGKKDDEIRTAQVLMRTIPSAQDSLQAMSLLDSLRSLALNGQAFGDLALKHSHDPETNWKKGSLGWMERAELDSAYQQVIANLDAGELSEKVRIGDSWHVFRLDQTKPSRDLTLDDDYLKIEEFASNHFANKKLEKMVERWRKEVFIEIRPSTTAARNSVTLQ